MGDDQLLLAVLRYAPLAFPLAGVLLVIWLAQQRLPHELQPDVLAALSETEALPLGSIRLRPPLCHLRVDERTLLLVLERLCHAGLAVRWYEAVDLPGGSGARQLVYRRVGGGRP